MSTSETKADSAALKALKLAAKSNSSGIERERAQKLAEKAAVEIKDGAVREAFRRIVDYLRQQERLAEIGQNRRGPTDEVLLIGRFGMVHSAEFAAVQLVDGFNEMPRPELVAAAPSSRFIEALGKKKESLAAIVEMITRDAAIADRSGAFDWLAKHGKPAELARFAPLLTSSRERLPHLPPYAKLLIVALRRDKNAVLLQAVLSGLKEDPVATSRIGVALTTDTKLMVQVLKAIPKLLGTDYKNFAMELLETWLLRYPGLPLRERESASSAVAALGLALLKKQKRTEPQQRALDLVSRILSDSVPKLKESGNVERFWIFSRASDLLQTLGAETHITRYGAGLLTSSLERAATGILAEPLLEALALNLGLTVLTAPGEEAAFDPTTHEDTKGGLLPDDPVVIRQSGWLLDDKVIRRAKVERK